MRVIGTAGHVDHGKSSLVQALTGTDPDRLAEEKARAMTIDLGFAWLRLDDGELVSIIDVPGHEDFIKNMLAGVGGIDLAMLVIAADESVMPQTREHLHILDLLQVPAGLVALTKSDLVVEPDWLELVELEIVETLDGTVLEGAPVIPLSSRTGEGLPALRAALARLLAATTPRSDLGRPRLSVDRVFSLSGFGTVVTGTLLDGTLAVGEEIELLPSAVRGRVRGLQSHNQQVERAAPGRRLAVNISGVDREQVARGDLLAHPGDYRSSRLLDVTLRLLPDADGPLRHDQEVELFVGASQRIGRLRLVGSRALRPGERGFAQLRLESPVAVARGDRYILRRPSPARTLGGGRVLDPFPARRWRRFRSETLDRFRGLAEGGPTALLLQRLAATEPTDGAALLATLPLSPEAATAALDETLAEGHARRLEDGTLLTAAGWSRRRERLMTALAAVHDRHPLRPGLPREEVAGRLHLSPRQSAAFLAALAEAGEVQLGESWVAAAGWEVRLSADERRAADSLLARFAATPFAPPNPSQATEMAGEEVVGYLVERGDLVRLSHEVLLGREAYEQMVSGVRALHAAGDEITAAALRDRFATSRKYAIALLEHLDTLKVTRRIGNRRILRG